MARYTVTLESAAAIAADTAFGWLRPVAGAGGKLRRVTVGCATSSGITPNSQQAMLGIARITNAGTTPGGAITPAKMDPNAPAAQSVFNTTYATPPTVTSPDAWKIPFNTQSGADLPWEGVEELVYAAGTTDGFAFFNRKNALPASHLLVVSLEFEE